MSLRTFFMTVLVLCWGWKAFAVPVKKPKIEKSRHATILLTVVNVLWEPARIMIFVLCHESRRETKCQEEKVRSIEYVVQLRCCLLAQGNQSLVKPKSYVKLLSSENAINKQNERIYANTIHTSTATAAKQFLGPVIRWREVFHDMSTLLRYSELDTSPSSLQPSRGRSNFYSLPKWLVEIRGVWWTGGKAKEIKIKKGNIKYFKIRTCLGVCKRAKHLEHGIVVVSVKLVTSEKQNSAF